MNPFDHMNLPSERYVFASIRKEIKMERINSIDAFLEYHLTEGKENFQIHDVDETLKVIRENESHYVSTAFQIRGLKVFAYCHIDAIQYIHHDVIRILEQDHPDRDFDEVPWEGYFYKNGERTQIPHYCDTLISVDRHYILSFSTSMSMIGSFLKNEFGKIESISMGDNILNYEWNPQTMSYEQCKCKVVGIFTKDDFDWLSLKRMHRTAVGYRLGKQFRMPQYLSTQVRSI